MIHYIELEKEITDKFDIAKFFSFTNMVHDPLTSYFLEKIQTLPFFGRKEITVEVNRPDLLASNIYNDTQYWWLLLEYNNILKFTDLKVGKEINYFNIDDLENLYYTLKTAQLKNIISLEAVSENNDNTTSSGSSNTGDLNRVFDVINQDVIIINHDMNKMPTPSFVTEDLSGNLVNEEIFWRYTAGLETKQIVIILHTPKTGKVILN